MPGHKGLEILKEYGRLAQLVRAFPLQGKGPWFDSTSAQVFRILFRPPWNYGLILLLFGAVACATLRGGSAMLSHNTWLIRQAIWRKFGGG